MKPSVLLAAGMLLGVLLESQALAAVDGRYAWVDAVQAPAWVERDGLRQPLVPGQELHNWDHVVTGDQARVLLRLAEGSAVKVGANAEVTLNALGRKEGSVFTAALDVLRGAFRLTTEVFQRSRDKRAINVRVATLTAGIRGTDIWGKSDAERDLICLLEGHITVVHPQAEPLAMDEAMSIYAAPRGQAPQPVAAVDGEQMGRWAAETELQPGAPTLRRGGRWQVVLGVVDTEAEALDLYDRARDAGYPVRVRPRAMKAAVEGAADRTYRYAVALSGLASRAEAAVAARNIGAALEIAAPAVSR